MPHGDAAGLARPRASPQAGRRGRPGRRDGLCAAVEHEGPAGSPRRSGDSAMTSPGPALRAGSVDPRGRGAALRRGLQPARLRHPLVAPRRGRGTVRRPVGALARQRRRLGTVLPRCGGAHVFRSRRRAPLLRPGDQIHRRGQGPAAAVGRRTGGPAPEPLLRHLGPHRAPCPGVARGGVGPLAVPQARLGVRSDGRSSKPATPRHFCPGEGSHSRSSPAALTWRRLGGDWLRRGSSAHSRRPASYTVRAPWVGLWLGLPSDPASR